MCHSTKKVKSLIEVPYVVEVKVHVLSFNMNLITSPYRVPTPSYPFRGSLGDQVKGHFPKKVKSLIDLKVQVLIFNMNLFSSSWHIPRPSNPIGKNLGDQGTCHSPKKLKSLLEFPYVAHLKVQVLIFNMNVFSSP